MLPPITLQISLAPSDYRLAEALLPHQVNAWRGEVSEILLTIDGRRSRGRFGEQWAAGRARISALAAGIAGARVIEVDYSPETQAAVSSEFFGGASIPDKDCRGGPYYAYFFGLYSAKHDWVLHSDADMFFGGGSSTWLAEAAGLRAECPELLFTAPLSGPPSVDGTLQQLKTTPRQINGERVYFFSEISTRLFLFSRAQFHREIGALRPRPPKARARLIAFFDGHPPAELPETLISEAMTKRGLCRAEFLGRPPGRWSLHPPYRSADFYAKLPSLVLKVEAGDLPPAQLGDHDINDSLVDWSEARARMARRRWWRRLLERFLGGAS